MKLKIGALLTIITEVMLPYLNGLELDADSELGTLRDALQEATKDDVVDHTIDEVIGLTTNWTDADRVVKRLLRITKLFIKYAPTDDPHIAALVQGLKAASAGTWEMRSTQTEFDVSYKLTAKAYHKYMAAKAAQPTL